MGAYDLKTDILKLKVKYPLRDVSIKLQKICEDLDADTQRIQTDDPFDVIEPADIYVRASGYKLLGGGWAVDICVFDNGNYCDVNLVALAESGLTKFTYGMAQDSDAMRHSLRMSTSKKFREQIANALR